ncbi:MAG: YkgJ family cysteine cluster protein [Myxococcota bacterium]
MLPVLHAEVDARAAEVAARHEGQLACRPGCSGCCLDGLTVFEVEAERIRSEFPDVLHQAPGPRGGCAFLDAAHRCRIYAARPYVCRTQGLPLRWIEADEVDGEEVTEARDVCALNLVDADLVALPPDECFELGPFESRLAALQAERQGARPGASLERVALRALFEGSA